MAAINKGALAIAKSRHSEQCSYEREDGSQCKCWAQRDGSGLCNFHSLTPEEQRERGKKGGRATARQHAMRKALRELSRRGPRIPVDEHKEALRALRATEERLLELHAQGRLSPLELPLHLRQRVLPRQGVHT